MKCSRCQQENPPQAKFCLECGAAVAATRPPSRSSAETGAEIEALRRSLNEALEQQAATSEILSIIVTAPTDLKRVLDTLAESAARFCAAYDAGIWRLDGDVLRLVGHHGPIPTPLGRTIPAIRGTVVGRSALDGQMVQVADLQAETEEFPEGSRFARELGHRTLVSVPLLREGVVIGAIGLRRTEIQPFSEKQIALLKTFADQAVIAIENVRLFTELQEKNHALTQAHAQVSEALEQQTATAEILRVISSSPTDYQPVFDTIVRTAGLVCGAVDAVLWTTDGDELVVRAHHGPLPATIGARQPTHGSVAGHAVREARVVHVRDLTGADDFPVGRDLARRLGWRTTLSAPLLREGVAIGAILIRRSEVRPFSDQQIALLQTFADQAVIAIENVRLFTELQQKNRALTEAHAQVTEALAQQTATAEILRAISASPTDVQPVFDTIVHSAARLLDGHSANVLRVVGDELHIAALTLISDTVDAETRATFPVPLVQAGVASHTIRTRRPYIVVDVETDPLVTPRLRYTAPLRGFRSMLMVPMLRQGHPIGVITVTRQATGGYSENEVALLQTFADQAVIAIENVRLFKELQDRNRDLGEALEQQTATGEILRVIASSPTDLQRVLDAVAESAGQLCQAADTFVLLVEGDQLQVAAVHGSVDAEAARLSNSIHRGWVAGRAVVDARTVHVQDLANAAAEYPLGREIALRFGHRTALATPLLREGVPIGALFLRRRDLRPFSDKEIALLKTFADQAVIAIENVRLFTELQEKNEAVTQAHAQVTEALEQQTATSEILRTIAQAQTDVQPVFDTIVRSAARLCRAVHAAVFVTDGGTVDAPANYGSVPEALAAARARFPRPLAMDSTAGMAILTRALVHVPDVEEPSTHDFVRQSGRLLGFRSVVTVPMLREGKAVGAILVARRETGRFPDAELQLLRTFADQAVIAVENVRLFKELKARTAALTRSVDQLTALGEVGRAVSSTLDLETVLTTIVSRAVELSGLDGGVVFEYDEVAEEFVQRAQTETGGALAEARRTNRIRKGEGVLGQTAITLESVQVPDITVPDAYAGRLRENLIESGIRAILAVPMVYEGRLIGCLGVTRNHPGDFPGDTIELLRTFATQSALAIQNARLFREIEIKSRELEVASQHKSEFLANMSHELRTPLNAIIGFSEVLNERMFGELNDKQEEYLKDIHASGQHLLSLINDILDLSKIEAGRMELELTDFHVSVTLDNALTLVRERAGRRGITLDLTVDEQLDQIHADERKVRQVVLNLLSNAIKFTPEGGRIEVRAVPVDGSVEISVSDTGVGIAPEDQEPIFEEFKQVGTAAKKVEGTGLGLALSRRFVELHGGRIWVESEVGVGSTFTFTLPVRTGA